MDSKLCKFFSSNISFDNDLHERNIRSKPKRKQNKKKIKNENHIYYDESFNDIGPVLSALLLALSHPASSYIVCHIFHFVDFSINFSLFAHFVWMNVCVYIFHLPSQNHPMDCIQSVCLPSQNKYQFCPSLFISL